MNLKRTVTMVVGCAALAAWLSAAMTTGRHQPAVLDLAPPPIETDGAALAKEIARLHERLRPEGTPRQQARNLFVFGSPSRSVMRAPLAITPPPDAPPSAPVVSFALTLAGIAEDPVDRSSDANGGVVRTAIVSGRGQVFLVKEGDTIVDRDIAYRVGKISSDSVALTDVRDGMVHELTMK
jgi:hypothetical protein